METTDITKYVANQDSLLQKVLESWLSTLDNEVASLSKEKDIYIITPKNKNSAMVKIWLSDDAKHIGFSAGKYSWWADNAPLNQDKIIAILSAIANGNFAEKSRCFAGKVLVSKGTIKLNSGNKYTYGQLNPLSLLPDSLWLWRNHNYEAYDKNA